MPMAYEDYHNSLLEKIATLTRERDEARAKVERLRKGLEKIRDTAANGTERIEEEYFVIATEILDGF